MEAAEETLTYLDDTGLHRKLLLRDKDKKHAHSKGETRSEESNYVDLDMKPTDGTRTVKVSFTGEGNQLSVIKCDSLKSGTVDTRGWVSGEPPLGTLTKVANSDQDSENDRQLQAELDPSDCSENVRNESDELRYTDMYLNSKTESDDGASVVLSDQCGSDTVQDESHYITTHEIQLTELDHDVDYDLGRGTCWELEDDNLVYSFVDYASFESDETHEGTLIEESRSQAKVQSNLGGAVVSTEQEESDLCDWDKCASSDESVGKDQSEDAHVGGIHLSIKATSRPANEPVGGPGSPGARVGPLRDPVPYFIPAPGRQHLASKLRRNDINEYFSEASSSISELDDADKEVRNLTAKSFRSLARPYFDAINLSTSSESSMSEYGLNKWSAYVDWNYEGKERGVIAHKTPRSTLEMNKSVDTERRGEFITDATAPQTNLHTVNKTTTPQQASSKKLEVQDPVQSQQREVTLNVHCNVEAPDGTRRHKSSKNARSSEVSGTVLSRSQYRQYHVTESDGDTNNRATCASSLLKNVISKKMQFEQERKLQRGQTCNRHPALSSDRSLGRGLLRQTSESGSGLSGYSNDDQSLDGSRPSSCGVSEQQKSTEPPDESNKGHGHPKGQLSHSQSSAFDSLKVDEPEPAKEAKHTVVSDTQSTAKEEIDTSSMLTKLLFVPSWQILSRQRGFNEDLNHTPATGTQKCQFKTGNNGKIIGKDEMETGIRPEIKIHLRSVKENKGCTLNIANLLTPKISYSSVNTFRTAGDAKCHILSATDKFPNFAVRDVRETKCKFQTPIYRVRDVRKLVKSSYRFVSLDKSESKRSTAADKTEEKGKMEPVKHLSNTSPIVIKCHSVKTNATSQKQAEARIPHQSDFQSSTDTKPLSKQRQDKFTGETAERRNEPAIPKQAAIEKIKAAVKTMEQLYVFDRNEWKRKTQAPQPIAGSHVRSLIAREEQGEEQLEATNTDRIPQALIPTTQTGKAQEKEGAANVMHVPFTRDTFKSQQSKTFSNRSVLHFGNNNKAHVSISSANNSVPQSSVLQTSTMKSSRAPAAPLSVKIEPTKHIQVEQGKVKIIPTNPTVTQGGSDSENYLTIPGQGYTSEIPLRNQEPASTEGNLHVSQAHTCDSQTPEQKRSPLIMDYPAASIYHHAAAAATRAPQTQQQVTSISSSDPTAPPFPQSQRKMLLDPSTGHYYLVDTAIQATTKRLFDPETGQYVDVPMPHSPVAPVTPVPLSLSPVTLSPGAYTPSYMIYPSFIPSPTLPAQAVLPHLPCHSEDAGVDKVKNARSPRLETSTAGAESVYYSATGEAPQGALQLPVSCRGGGASSERKPVISITTQQGPRIIAPPSFDGTTMSFVVEHR
ncbi:uncharacterized protein C4orf54 homolog [Solea solea]|uniref:uncharacterized protein C4orf54 homolog n=1 Tax=Solea solea TaxID=90069 RepID=UPI002729D04D|nr:uncharacterized protein C4orf54 homolog [Solea solea]